MFITCKLTNNCFKDEYEKKHDFYDEYHEDGGHEDHGAWHEEHEGEKGGHVKKNYLNAEHNEVIIRKEKNTSPTVAPTFAFRLRHAFIVRFISVYLRNFRIITTRERNTMVVIVITRKPVTSRSRDTIVTTSTIRSTVIKMVTLRGTSGRNQIITDKRNLLISEFSRFLDIFVQNIIIIL